jgi:SAM-dependent methyltransferase
MADWGQGYVSDVEYGRGFYREQSPTLLNLSCLLAGVEPPSLEQGFTYCELGCGQGFTALVLAAANPGSNFIGIDFNPAHIARAEAQARAADLDNIRFIEASFEDLANETGTGLPAFDFVTLHGVYSWVSVANRKAIVAFLARQLKPGGVAYVSYNCMPGWTRALPLQRMLYEFAALVPDRSDRQIDRAVGLIQELADAGASCIADNPFMEMLTRTSAQGELVYLAHEYLNRNWEPLYHADVARELAKAKLEFVGSAWALDHFAELNFSIEQRALIDRAGPPAMQETVKDMLLNRRFRGDVFVRGARRLDNRQRDSLLRETGLALVVPREEVQYKLKVTVGEAELPEQTYGPIFDALSERPRTISELLDLPELRGVSRTNPVELAGMLAGAQQVLPVTDAASGYRAEATANRFNRSLARDVEHEPFNKRLALASPVLGTGIHAGVIDLAAFDALSAGRGPDVREVAHRLWKPLASRGEKLLHEGKPVEGEEESLGLLVKKVELALRAQEPVWRRLGIVSAAIV